MPKRVTLTAEEKAQRRAAKKAERKNAKLAKAHPLFVEQLAAEGAFTSPDAEYWATKRQVAQGVEGCAEIAGQAFNGLLWIDLQMVERVAARLCGWHFEGMRDYIRKTYPMPNYGRNAWRDRLTGGPFPCRFELRFDPAKVNQSNTDGRYLVDAEIFPGGFCTSAEFAALLPNKPAPPVEHDDGGLGDLLAQVFDGEKS